MKANSEGTSYLILILQIQIPQVPLHFSIGTERNESATTWTNNFERPMLESIYCRCETSTRRLRESSVFFVSAEFHTGWMPVLNWYELIWSIKHQDFSLVIVDYCLMMTGLLQVETMLLGTATSLLCTNVCKVATSTMHCTFMSVAWESYHLRLCPTLADAFPGLVSAHEYGVQNDLVRSVLEE